MNTFLSEANCNDSGKCAKRTTHQREKLNYGFKKNVITVAQKIKLPVFSVHLKVRRACLPPKPPSDSCRLLDLYTYCCSRPQGENTHSVPDHSIYPINVIYEHNLQLYSYLIRLFDTYYSFFYMEPYGC